MPEESSGNWKYLYRVKHLATQVGFEYYAKVPWKKGTFVSNTGRKSHNTEDVILFTKGKPIAWRKDASYASNVYMSGIRMLPTHFNVQPPQGELRIQKSEKPVKLLKDILEYVVPEGGVVLDQFAGSASTAKACEELGLNCICIECDASRIDAAADRLGLLQFHNHRWT